MYFLYEYTVMVGSFKHDMNRLAIWHTGNLLTNWETLGKLRRICCMEFIHFWDTKLESCSHMSIDPEVTDFVSPCKCIWRSGDIVSFVIYGTYIQGRFNQSTNYPDWMWSSLLGWSAASLIWHSCSPQNTCKLYVLPPHPPHMHACARLHTHTHTLTYLLTYLHKTHRHVQSRIMI